MLSEGTGFITGSSQTHRSFVSKIAFLSQTSALSVNYRLALEYPFPKSAQGTVADGLLGKAGCMQRILIANIEQNVFHKFFIRAAKHFF